jgi:thiol-disulfide isomerase/thioredoxin
MQPTEGNAQSQDTRNATNNDSLREISAPSQATRREFLGAVGAGLGALAVPGIVNGEGIRATQVEKRGTNIGDKFPEMKHKGIDNKDIDLATQTAGKITIVEVWGPWCPPCRAQVPHLKDASKALEGKDFIDPKTGEDIGSGFAVYTLAANINSRDEANWQQAVKTGRMINYGGDFSLPGTLHTRVTGIREVQAIQKKYGIAGYPTNFVLDGEGRVIMKNVDTGSLSTKLKDYIKPEEPKDQ